MKVLKYVKENAKKNPDCFSLVSFPSMPQSSIRSPAPSCRQPAVLTVPDIVDTLEDFELMGDDLDILLDGFPTEAEVKCVLVLRLSCRPGNCSWNDYYYG